jgi:hypothetical protein
METKTIDLNAVREALEQGFEWDYVEAEGVNSLRFDFRCGESSFWLYPVTRSVSGEKPRNWKALIYIISNFGFTQFDWE